MDRPLRLIGILVAAALLVPACTTETTPGPEGSSPDSSPSTVAATSPSPGTTTSTTPPRAVAEAWQQFHEHRVAAASATEAPAPDDFDGLVTEAARDRVVALVEAARGDVAVEIVGVETRPQVEVAGDGTARVSDCVLVGQRPGSGGDTATQSQVWSGTYVRADSSWRLDQLQPGEADCVPAELQEDLVGAYLTWLDGIGQWWDPPDPDHPLLARRMVAPGLQDMQDLLADHAEQGVVYRDPHDPVNAVVFELGIGSATVSDCYPADPDVGAYDRETGERLTELSATPTQGQRDRLTVDLERDGDDWKVSGWQSRVDADCTPGGTPYVVAP